MKAFSIYDLATGILTGEVIHATAALAAANTPAGMGLVEGEHDHLAVMLDVSSGALTARTVSPEGDLHHQWAWDATAQRWQRVPSAARQAQLAQQERERTVQQLEASQARALRALAIDPNDQVARERLQQIEAAIVATGIREGT